MIALPLVQAAERADWGARRRFPWWIFLGGALLGCLYLPSLATRFDFIDDGFVVYPASPMPLGSRLGLVWDKIDANFNDLGPFRPVLWCHWEVEAELLGAHELPWRASRLAWTILAAVILLWLLQELGIRPWAALAAAALAMWNPYRNEIWTSLSLSEGVAMPYALLALVSAVRAARSSRAWCWDVAGVVCILAALGCKNTFAAVVPAQIYLRIAPNSRDFLDGLRRHGRRASLLALPLLLPAFHYVYFATHWRPGQYAIEGPSWAQMERLLLALRGAMSLEFVGIGLVAAVSALAENRLWLRAHEAKGGSRSWLTTLLAGNKPLWTRYRVALLAGLLLLLAGIAVYLPMNAMSGRYTIPAVWGLDLMAAVLFSAVLDEARPVGRKAAFAALACGLICVAAANLGRQEKFAARANLLWNALEWVEEEAPAGACVAWQCGPALGAEEGIHFNWHLQGRGRKKVSVVLVDEYGQPLSRPELPWKGGGTLIPTVIITGSPSQPRDGWDMRQALRIPYWMSKRKQECYVWTPAQGNPTESALAAR